MRTPGCARRGVGLVAALSLLFAGPLAAQDPERLFGEVINVRVMNLEVVVTDKNGRRVAGLEPGDFLITVDGRPMPVEYFSEIRDGALMEEDEAWPAAARSPGTSLLVFIDEVFPMGRDHDRALGHLVDSLAFLAPGDRVAVVAFDGDEIDMLTDWTGSAETLRRVFEEAKKRPSRGFEHQVLSRALSDTNPRSVQYMQRQRIERVTLAATSAMRSFANPPGRKVMLLLAGGWLSGYPGSGYEVSPTLANLPDRLGYRDLYRPLADTANLLGYTLYPVDVKIYQVPSGASAEFALPRDAAYARDRALAEQASENSTLLRLARETGGIAFLESRRRNAFAATLDDTRSYYSLGFTPDWKGEDQRHRIAVEVRDPDHRVRTRRSFSDLSRQTEVTMMVESALLFGNAPAPGSLTVRLGDPVGEGQLGSRKIVVPMAIEIPLDGLTFLPRRGGGWETELELRFAVEDGRGGRNEIDIEPVRFTLPERPPPGQFVVYDTGVRLRRRKHDLVISLYDPVSGQLRWTRVGVAP